MNPTSMVVVHEFDLLEAVFHESNFLEIEPMKINSRILDELPMTSA
jgi:hypothetical protein